MKRYRFIKTGRHKDTVRWSKVLTPEELSRIEKHVNSLSKQEQIIFHLLIGTGLRETELAYLLVKDCPGTLGVNAVEVVQGKGNKSRTISISQELREKIDRYINQDRPATLPRWIKKDDGDKFLLYNRQGRPYLQKCKIRRFVKKENRIVKKTIVRASRTLYRIIKNYGSRAAIDKTVRPHMFRHTYAVKSLAEGLNPLELMANMGHANIQTTQQYIHLVPAWREMGKIGRNLS